MPTRTSLRDGWLAQFSDLEPMLNGADYARKWQFRPGFQDVLDTLNAGLPEAFPGAKTAQGVLDDAQSVGEQVRAREQRSDLWSKLSFCRVCVLRAEEDHRPGKKQHVTRNT